MNISCSQHSLESEFANWLAKQTKNNGDNYSFYTREQYVKALHIFPEKLPALNLPKDVLYRLTSEEDISAVYNRMKQEKDFEELDYRYSHHTFSAAMQHYLRFIKERNN